VRDAVAVAEGEPDALALSVQLLLDVTVLDLLLEELCDADSVLEREGLPLAVPVWVSVAEKEPVSERVPVFEDVIVSVAEDDKLSDTLRLGVRLFDSDNERVALREADKLRE
jgi:hypothetical protein